MQRHRIDQRLQVVFAVPHRPLQRIGAITGQAVGLVVEHVPLAVVAIHQVDQAGHQSLQPLAQAETVAFAHHPVCVQQGQQRLHPHRLQGELELDFRPPFARRQVAQAHTLGQGHGQRVPGQARGQGDAVVHFIGTIAFAGQGLGDHRGLAGRSVVAIAPVSPRSEVGVLQHRVQGHAVAVAGKARIEARIRRGIVAGVGLVVAAAGRHGGRAAAVAERIGTGQLAEAVYPPVAVQSSQQRSRRRHRSLGSGGQPGQPGRRHLWIELHARRPQGLGIGQHRRQRRGVAATERTGGNPQCLGGTGQADVEQARILGTLLLFPLLADRVPVDFGQFELPVQLATIASIVHRAVPR